MKEKEEWETEIEDFYNKMQKIQDANNPDIYLVPKKTWDALIKQIQYFESALKDARGQRENWKKKYLQLKNEKN